MELPQGVEEDGLLLWTVLVWELPHSILKGVSEPDAAVMDVVLADFVYCVLILYSIANSKCSSLVSIPFYSFCKLMY